jgi:hypothetical protein
MAFLCVWAARCRIWPELQQQRIDVECSRKGHDGGQGWARVTVVFELADGVLGHLATPLELLLCPLQLEPPRPKVDRFHDPPNLLPLWDILSNHHVFPN